MKRERIVPDKVFRQVEDARKQRLSSLIVESKLPLIQISEETGIARKTIARAVACGGITYTTAVRLEYFLELYARRKKTI